MSNDDNGNTAISIIRYRTRPEAAQENQKLVEEVYAELAEKAPDGVRYMTLRLADGVTFVHVVTYEDGPEPLTGLAAFQRFSESVGDRVVAPPEREEATVVGAYRFR
jgi:hypothetical protein